MLYIFLAWWVVTIKGNFNQENCQCLSPTSGYKRSAGSSEMLVSSYKSTWHHIPEDCNLHINTWLKPKLQIGWPTVFVAREQKVVTGLTVIYQR
jgi:hypothetical protein